jgi:CheY-like chemotaxis protein
VLVIEDDPSVRLLVIQVLEELGYRAIETEERPRRRADPAVLGADRPADQRRRLPGLNGRQLAEIARESRPGLPILFMTGYAGRPPTRRRSWSGAWRSSPSPSPSTSWPGASAPSSEEAFHG